MPPDVVASPLFSEDLAPVPRARRTYEFAALWIAMAHCIPTYMLAGGLIAVGMNWWQALGTILLGNVIVLVSILLNAHPGTKYGIPFPVLARASFGTVGANVPAVQGASVNSAAGRAAGSVLAPLRSGALTKWQPQCSLPWHERSR